MASLSLVLEKIEESQVKVSLAEENLPVILSNFALRQYDSIAVMSPGVD